MKKDMEQFDDFDLERNESFARESCDGIFSTSTPRNTRSVSYLDITHSQGRDGLSPSAVGLERMRSLSQSITDLNILREKQMGRRHEVSILFEDNFLNEHTRKLQEARQKIKALEAKYCNPKRRRSHLNPSTELDLERQRLTLDVSSHGGFASSITKENQSKIHREDNNNSVAKSDEAGLAPKQEITLEDSNNKDESDSGILADRTSAVNDVTQAARRPITWTFNDGIVNVYKSGLSHDWHNRANSILVEGETSTTGRRGSIGSTGFRQEPYAATNSFEKAKWQSMPNLGQNHDNFPDDQQMMYGEAIPVDPEEKGVQRKKKRGWRSSTYMVNTSPGQDENEKYKKKHKSWLKSKFFNKRNSLKPKGYALKIPIVGAPKEAQPIGRIIGPHSKTHHAYTLELCRPESGSYGFHLQNGYRQFKKGVFVSRISDKKAKKFLGGFIHVGDEVLEINSTNVQEQNYSTVYKLLTSSEKLSLTLLPYTARSKR